MLHTMYDANGIGLAATQVDEHIRLVVMDLSEDRNEEILVKNSTLWRGPQTEFHLKC